MLDVPLGRVYRAALGHGLAGLWRELPERRQTVPVLADRAVFVPTVADAATLAAAKDRRSWGSRLLISNSATETY